MSSLKKHKTYNSRKKRMGVSFVKVGKYNSIKMTKEQKKLEQSYAFCILWDSFKYEEINPYVAQELHTRLESNKKNLPLVIIGDAKFPPLTHEVDRYYLVYNPDNFIGEYEMRLFGENTFLTFFLNKPEDFDKIREIAHRTVYLGSLCRILLICSSDAVLPQKKIRKESMFDYDIVFVKNGENYLPHHKTLKSFEYRIAKNL
jgi:hypothetical protein